MSNKKTRAPFVWIISGPSGSGKTTLCEALLEERVWRRLLLKSVSFTTRPLRKGEREGRDYAHVSPRRFLQLRKRGAFLEHEKIFGFFYGTPKKVISDAQRRGKDLLLCIDVKGARSVRRHFRDNVASVFIVPPRRKALNDRLLRRSTEDKKDIEKRLRRVKIELAFKKDYDYVVVNDKFDTALKTLKTILSAGHKEGYGVYSTGKAH